jgi:hypothetical protein
VLQFMELHDLFSTPAGRYRMSRGTAVTDTAA